MINAGIIDQISVVIIIYFAWRGYKKGLIAEAFKIMGIIFGIVIAMKYFDTLSGFIGRMYGNPDGLNRFVVVGLVILVSVLLFALLGRFIKKVLRNFLTETIDKYTGVLLGGFKGMLLISAFMPLISLLPSGGGFADSVKENSAMYERLNGIAPAVYSKMSGLLPGTGDLDQEVLGNFLQKFDSGSLDINDLQKALNQGDMPGVPDEYKSILKDYNFGNDEEIQKLIEDPTQNSDVQDVLRKYQKQMNIK